eukprot:COSAG01_NODE_42173_length_442_cov_6.816327_1_plen_63_part_10
MPPRRSSHATTASLTVRSVHLRTLRRCPIRYLAWVTSFDGALAAAVGAAAELRRLMVCVGLTH